MDHTAIGFELTNDAAVAGGGKHVTQISYKPIADTTVAPAPYQAPVPPPQDGNLYPAIGQPAQPSHANPIGFEDTAAPTKPIGFEMQAVNNEDNGPTVVISETVPLDNKKGDIEEELSLIPRSKDPQLEETMYFDDGVRRIDYVLAFEPGTADKENRVAKREYFQKELEREGLQLEFEKALESKSGKVSFVKVHAPWDILAKGAEMMNMKMPLAPNDMNFGPSSIFDCIPTPFDLDQSLMEEDDNYFTAPFNRNRMEQLLHKSHTSDSSIWFVIKDKDSFFSNSQRSRIVYAILSRSFYEDADPQNPAKRRFGIKKLLANGSYSAAYPLHDGKYTSEHSILTRGKRNDRHLLYELWARPKAWYKFQPLDKIRDYFGEKIGIYFAWLGFYTTMLVPASIVGLVAFIYGCATLLDDTISNEICDVNKAGNFTMCPLCDNRCTYWRLQESCSYSRATYLFDNPATVAFACFMALWASFFHDFWKRKQNEIEYDWDTADFEMEEETVRPEFENRVRRKRENPINKRLEPYVPNWSKCCRYGTTVSILLFFMAIVLVAVVGVIIYRIVIAAVLSRTGQDDVKGRAGLIASATAACINLVIIFLLNFIYQRIAEALTELEQHRTESEWEDAFTFKMFLFQFVNYYASIIYIAFFKGRFVGRPGDYDRNLFGFRQEECDPAGCLIELCIQLGIIMVGKQIFANFKEIILPKVMVWFKSRSIGKDKEDKVYTHWEQDYNLADQPKLGLFDEYLEMVIQFGFVTIFVAAFPLAPLCALINNIIEIRLDAYKFITQWKRPLATRAQDIGVWFGILQGISAIAVISNAAIIAFTSEFIPRMVYKYGYSNDGTLNDYYTNFSMSVFNTADFDEDGLPDEIEPQFGTNVTECWYRAFRKPPGVEGEYEYTMAFWHVFAARLAFVVVFENLIVFLTWLVMYLIPDMPYQVKMQMLREKYLAKQALFHAEELKEARPKTE
ncbi:anoctamin-4-like isoform X3 [Ruditapes philippinarum]|uniref:anoctamin-4-like isoform X3 n=1 Tax=Ruditapes philippinarum TaxID=129788 RepID=UPI00295A9BE0|nr:anoctamin-4-like isoform X3 [Ruditapes philippinarum]